MESNFKDDMQREEIRGIFALGLLAVLVSIRLGINLETIYIDWRPIILFFMDTTSFTWGVYAFFMVFAFSHDIFPIKFCKICYNVGRIALFSCISFLFLVAILIMIQFGIQVWLGPSM